MLKNIASSKYSSAVDSYSALNLTSKIRGMLIEKKDRNIKIDIGNNKALNIELKSNLQLNIGDTVLIDRNNILKSSLVKIPKDIILNKSEVDTYSDMLKNFDIDANEESLKIIKSLDNYGIEITKENIESYMIAKDSFKDISTLLDYDSAIKLVEMNIDIENESIQKIASYIDDLEEEKEGFKLIELFGKGELTTEQAEEIAKEIYGSKMGKDITDIIKSLHKNKVSITKKNIEKIDDVFYKLHNLKDIEDRTFVDTMKNKLDINIENLYKIKRYVKDENINLEIDAIDISHSLKIKAYETSTQAKQQLTDIELIALEDEIRNLMLELKIDVSEENIKLSKEFIKRNMDITKENIVNINEMKKALEVIIKGLDTETASQIMKEIDIDTADIKLIAEKIKEIKNSNGQLEVDLIQEDIQNIINKLDILKKIDEKDILTLIENNVDFKIKNIEQVIFGNIETAYTDDILKATAEGINKISTAIREIGNQEINIIEFQLKKNIPLTIMNMQKNSIYFNTANNAKEPKFHGNSNIIRTLNSNELVASRLSIQRSMEAYRSYNNLRENLTINMIKDALSKNIQIENMELNLASRYVDEYRKLNMNFKISEEVKQEHAKEIIDNAYDIATNSEENIMFLIKNKRPLSFKELYETNLMFKNREQLGHKIVDIEKFVSESNDEELNQKFQNLKKDIIEISKSMKGSIEDVEESYKQMEKSIKDIEDTIENFTQDQSELMNKKPKSISEKIDENKIIAKENNIIQLPIYMNGQFTNLNMYFRDKNKGGLKKDSDDISAVLSIDTVNMGNLNINLEIQKKNIDIKIGLKNIEDKIHMDEYKEALLELLEQNDYSVREIEFYKEGEERKFINDDLKSEKPLISKGNLDIKI